MEPSVEEGNEKVEEHIIFYELFSKFQKSVLRKRKRECYFTLKTFTRLTTLAI
jgi:hypothetical protein